MPFAGGVFTRLYNWTTDRNNSVKIMASRMDAEFNGMATALSSCVLKDGTQTTTALVPFAAGISVGTTLTVGGGGTFTGDLGVGGALSVTGGASIGGQLSVTGTISGSA